MSSPYPDPENKGMTVKIDGSLTKDGLDLELSVVSSTMPTGDFRWKESNFGPPKLQQLYKTTEYRGRLVSQELYEWRDVKTVPASASDNSDEL